MKHLIYAVTMIPLLIVGNVALASDYERTQSGIATAPLIPDMEFQTDWYDNDNAENLIDDSYRNDWDAMGSYTIYKKRKINPGLAENKLEEYNRRYRKPYR